MFENNSLYIIVSIIFIFFILYMIFLLILSIIDRKLTGIKINIPKQDIVIDRLDNDKREQFTNNTNHNIDHNQHITSHDMKHETDKLSNISGFSHLEGQPYYIDKKKPIVDHEDDNNVFYKMHKISSYNNKEQSYGRTNYPDPDTMNSFDKKIFKSFYQDGMTLQDYVNWLYLHAEDGKKIKLPYEHMKYYTEIKNGRPLKYRKGICPPKAKADGHKSNSAEFYQNLYNDDIENEVKNRKINFPKLFNTNTQTRSPFDLSMIDEATKTHSKSITPFNTCNYTSMNNYEELPEMKGKMSAKNLNTMLTPKMSSMSPMSSGSSVPT